MSYTSFTGITSNRILGYEREKRRYEETDIEKSCNSEKMSITVYNSYSKISAEHRSLLTSDLLISS